MTSFAGIDVPGRAQVAFETNGSGWIGYLAELPGAFVRGQTEQEALSKVTDEIRRYCHWLGLKTRPSYSHTVSQVHRSQLNVEDADNELLLDYDRSSLDGDTFEEWRRIAAFSSVCFQALYDAVSLREWKDPARNRKTFYGDCPSSIQDVYQHVDRVQGFYIDCLGLGSDIQANAFVDRRQECLSRIADLYARETKGSIYCEAGEEWTIAKTLRRYIWHDHIHAKSIVRTLQRQSKLGLIDEFCDPFAFGALST